MKFIEKSLTQPGQAFSARDLIRRSLNGTMPAIFRQGSYDLDEDTYDNQEADDVFLDSEPQLEDIAALKDNIDDVREAVDNYVAKTRKAAREKGRTRPKGSQQADAQANEESAEGSAATAATA